MSDFLTICTVVPLVTESHAGYSGKQIAHAVSLDTNHANAFVIDAVENLCPPCGHRAQEA